MIRTRKADSPLRGFRFVFAMALILLVLFGGTALYASTEPPLDWSAGEPPGLFGGLRDMLRSRTLQVAIDEAELNALLKPELHARRRLGEHAEITGADFSLENGTLVVRMDITLWNRLRLPVTHKIRLSWEAPDIVAEHVSSSLKEIPLPKTLFPIGIIRVPLRPPEGWPVDIDRVEFGDDAVRILLRLRLS